MAVPISSTLQLDFEKKRQTLRKPQPKKKNPVIVAFHSKFRFFFVTGVNPHPKWGRFLPENRWKFDQTPLLFSCIPDQTYKEKGTERVWIKQDQSAMQKRFCTLQTLFYPGKNQPKPTIIFRGKGMKISGAEKASWDQRVHVRFQPKVWADRAFHKEWVDSVLLPAIRETAENEEESVVFCDNLDCYIQTDFVKQLRTVRAFRNLYPSQCTDYVH